MALSGWKYPEWFNKLFMAKTAKEIAQGAFNALPHVDTVWVDVNTGHFHLHPHQGGIQIERDAPLVTSDEDLQAQVELIIEQLGEGTTLKKARTEIGLAGFNKKDFDRAIEFAKSIIK